MNNTIQILLMEDNPMDRTSIRNLLEKKEECSIVYETAYCADFEKLVRTNTYDLIIIDFGIDWTDCMRILETVNIEISGVPVIICAENAEFGFNPQNLNIACFFISKKNLTDNLSNVIAFAHGHRQIVNQFDKEHKRLQRLNRYLRILRHLRKLVLHETNRENLLKSVCLFFNRFKLDSYAWIGLFEEKDGTFNPITWPDNEKRPGKQAFMHFGRLFSSIDFFELQKDGSRYFLCRDIFMSTKLPTVIINEFKNHIRSFITFPIMLDKKITGLFTVQSKELLLFCNDEVELLRELADDLSLILHKMNDIEINKEEKLELVKAKEKAEQADRLKNAFLMNISHEIRTPMNGILGFAELLGEENLTNKQMHDYINIINLSSRRMLDTINNLISISKIEAGDIKLNETEEDLIFLMKDISDMFRMSAVEKGLDFYFAEYENSRCILSKTDKLLFKFIISNLLTNAIKFTHKGYIEVGYRLEHNNLEIYVKDTGIGIDEKKFDLIFEKFRQGDEGPTRQFEGSGLGLAISKAYAEKLKGKLRVESVLGKGTVFYFTLPLIKNLETNTRETGLKNIRKRKSLKVLIVEDDDASAKLLNIIMKGFSREILYARNGDEAINMCLEINEIDLILMDLQMPGTNGFEATKQIRNFNKSVVVIAQSAYTLSQYKEKALLSGCNDFINKPVKRAELLSTIHRHFQNFTFGRQQMH